MVGDETGTDRERVKAGFRESIFGVSCNVLSATNNTNLHEEIKTYIKLMKPLEATTRLSYICIHIQYVRLIMGYVFIYHAEVEKESWSEVQRHQFIQVP